MIEFNYPLVKEYLTKKLFIPFCIFQTLFVLFQNLIYENRHEDVYREITMPCLALLVIFATYFLSNEVRQFMGEGIGYFGSIWNYIDIIPPIGIYLLTAIIVAGQYDYFIPESIDRSIQSIVTFFMWFKILYFLRIYRSTGYLISMIFEVIKDMRFFLLVLLITIIAFGDSMVSIALANENN
jgi:hypothetical protein